MSYYDSLTLVGFPKTEQSLGEKIARGINNYGDSWIEPVRGYYGGRSFTVTYGTDKDFGDPDINITEDLVLKTDNISTIDRIKAYVGSSLKQFANFLCSNIGKEYRAAARDGYMYFNKLLPSISQPQPEGHGPTDCSMAVCVFATAMLCMWCTYEPPKGHNR